MKKLFAGMAAAILAAVLAFPCYALTAEKAVLMDADTSRVLFEKNADASGLIASTTKIMTALIVCEQCNVLDRVKIPKAAVGIEGSSIYLQEGEILTVQELLYGLMLHSGNDAATALAIYCGGTVEGFAALMNDKAHRLGLEHTHFENPHGLDSPNHYASARDLATLTAYAMKNPIFRQTVSTAQVKISRRSLSNHNKLLRLYEGCNGVKTGYTKKAGRILVSSAVRNGRQLVAVTMNAPDDWQDHMQLLDMGFSRYSHKKVVEAGECVGYISIAGGVQKSAKLLAAEDVVICVADDENISVILQEPRFVYAPIVEGEPAGFSYIMVDKHIAKKVPLVFGETVLATEETHEPFWKRFFWRK